MAVPDYSNMAIPGINAPVVPTASFGSNLPGMDQMSGTMAGWGNGSSGLFTGNGPTLYGEGGLFAQSGNNPFGLGGNGPQVTNPGFMQKAGAWLSNGQNLSAVASGIGALTSAWMNYKNYQLAKDQLGLAKEGFELNARNQIQSYNTSLEDRIRGRTSDYSGKEADVQAYLARHSLHR